MTILQTLRAFLAKLISSAADDSVENIVKGISVMSDKLEALVVQHQAKIDEFEAQVAELATKKLASAEEIAKANAVTANLRALIGK